MYAAKLRDEIKAL